MTNLAEKQVQGGIRHGRNRLANGRQLRPNGGRGDGVIKPNHRQIPRHIEAAPVGHGNHRGRHVVVTRKDGRGRALAIEQGFRYYDFLRGDEPYKASWRAQPIVLNEVRIVGAKRTARLRHTAWSTGQSTKQWVKQHLLRRRRPQPATHGEPIDPQRHRLRVDVKAVTLHRFSIEKTAQGWEATVILDI